MPACQSILFCLPLLLDLDALVSPVSLDGQCLLTHAQTHKHWSGIQHQYLKTPETPHCSSNENVFKLIRMAQQRNDISVSSINRRRKRVHVRGCWMSGVIYQHVKKI